MKSFSHTNAASIAEVSTALADGKTYIIAGGTDILGILKESVLPAPPKNLINIKTIPGLDFIKEEKGVLKIGAATRLADIAENKNVKDKYTALSQAALHVASPNLRDMGTIGGNISQLSRCWYFRKPENRFECVRKGGRTCYAMRGDNRYHSIFGAVNGCINVNPGDIAPALIVLSAKVITDRRTIDAEYFFDVKNPGNTVLETDEVIREINIPAPPRGAKSAFMKFALRKSIDFPIVNCAVMVGGKNPRICLNAVAPKPYRATKAEEVIAGKRITEKLAEEAGEAAVADARPLRETRYKVQIAKTLVKRTLLAAG